MLYHKVRDALSVPTSEAMLPDATAQGRTTPSIWHRTEVIECRFAHGCTIEEEFDVC